MSNTQSRRDFLKIVGALPLCAAVSAVPFRAFGQDTTQPSAGDTGARSAAGATLKTSLNAYSFNKMLNDNLKNRGPGITLLQVMAFAAKCKFDGFDATGYYFPGYPEVPSESYIKELKKTASDLGLGISGSGVRDNLTTADKAVRAAAITHIKEWVEVAAKIGAPVLRVFADTQMRAMTWGDVAKGYTRDQVGTWIADALRQCADHGKQYGVCIGVQNHGDFLQTGDQLMALIAAVGSDYCRPIVDTGYFKTKDPYVDMEIVAPHAVNWQIKQSPFGEESDIATDLNRLLRIVRNSGYHGYLPIECLSPKGKPYDPYTIVPAFLKKLQDAIAQTA
jgi:sugar phosphate isomerase/epimerase